MEALSLQSMGVLFFVAVALFAGLGGGKLFRVIHFPQVVGYIVIGAVVGVSGLNILNHDIFEQMVPVEQFSLGLIGFMIGRELHVSVFKQLGKVIFTILCFEVVGTFLVVSGAVWFLTRQISIALIFGALATATAPAATVEVLWEYKARGILTTTIFSIVALDDVLALLVYAFAVAFTKTLIGHTAISVSSIIVVPLVHIAASITLGLISGFLLAWVAEKMHNEKQYLPLILATIMLNISLANFFHLSHILSCMILGMTLVNMNITRAGYAFKAIEDFTGPIYILFFVLVGSQLDIRQLPQMGLLGLVYIGARMLGKVVGTAVGGRVAQAEPVVQKYLGFALFDQAGVAIGLALSVRHEFNHLGADGKMIGDLVLNVIMASTFVVQLIGPPFVKYSITKAGERGLAGKTGSVYT